MRAAGQCARPQAEPTQHRGPAPNVLLFSWPVASVREGPRDPVPVFSVRASAGDKREWHNLPNGYR